MPRGGHRARRIPPEAALTDSPLCMLLTAMCAMTGSISSRGEAVGVVPSKDEAGKAYRESEGDTV